MDSKPLTNRRRLDVINDEWIEDCGLKLDRLHTEGDRQWKLHGKYQKYLAEENRILRQMQVMVDRFRFRLQRFYTVGPANRAEHEHAIAQGWAMPPEGKITAQQAKHWIETNDEMIRLNMELAEQNDVVDALNRILKSLDYRSGSVNSAIRMKIHNDGGRG